MPDRLVHIVDDVPELDDASWLPLVLVLDGFLDAGNAAGRAAQHLVDLSDGPVVATFDTARRTGSSPASEPFTCVPLISE